MLSGGFSFPWISEHVFIVHSYLIDCLARYKNLWDFEGLLLLFTPLTASPPVTPAHPTHTKKIENTEATKTRNWGGSLCSHSVPHGFSVNGYTSLRKRLCYAHAPWLLHLPTPSPCDSGGQSQFAMVYGSAHLLSLLFSLLTCKVRKEIANYRFQRNEYGFSSSSFWARWDTS